MKREEKEFNISKLKGLEVILKEDFYLNAKRNGGFDQDLYQISLQINFFLNKFD